MPCWQLRDFGAQAACEEQFSWDTHSWLNILFISSVMLREQLTSSSENLPLSASCSDSSSSDVSFLSFFLEATLGAESSSDYRAQLRAVGIWGARRGQELGVSGCGCPAAPGERRDSLLGL